MLKKEEPERDLKKCSFTQAEKLFAFFTAEVVEDMKCMILGVIGVVGQFTSRIYQSHRGEGMYVFVYSQVRTKYDINRTDHNDIHMGIL